MADHPPADAGHEHLEWQNFLEIVIFGIRDQIAEVGLTRAERYLPFIGTLFLFIAMANVCTILPFCEA